MKSKSGPAYTLIVHYAAANVFHEIFFHDVSYTLYFAYVDFFNKEFFRLSLNIVTHSYTECTTQLFNILGIRESENSNYRT
jgi:hypothetical protein